MNRFKTIDDMFQDIENTWKNSGYEEKLNELDGYCRIQLECAEFYDYEVRHYSKAATVTAFMSGSGVAGSIVMFAEGHYILGSAAVFVSGLSGFLCRLSHSIIKKNSEYQLNKSKEYIRYFNKAVHENYRQANMIKWQEKEYAELFWDTTLARGSSLEIKKV